MFIRQRRAERGELAEESVVTTPRAKIGGISNGLVGCIYYIALLLAIPAFDIQLVRSAALTAAVLAAAFSLYLAYSLLFVTRRPCAYCWSGHVINWLILLLLITNSKQIG